MISLSAKIRKDKKSKTISKKEVLLAILYGPKIKNLNLELNLKEFGKVYKEAGESSLVSLNVEGQKNEFLVLIRDIQFTPVTGRSIHVDLYQPSLKEEVQIAVPIVLKGVSGAVKNLGGTLVKNISEIEVKALPQKLPKQIEVSVENLNTFDDYVLVKNLQIPEGVKVLRGPEEILVSVSPPEKVEGEKRIEESEEKEKAEKTEEKKEQKETGKPSLTKDSKGKNEKK